ncbi:MAG: rod shape-determining protein RodA [Saprospiraceae bacterium]|jgi:rod shape determining protein RodA|nr:rod shape-determining protein RodA [Saprospiraceae bacterium]MBP9209100.1 rod shape-determining protein RodA [Saprospiraceae bacterium]MBV6473669.1 putative lipid II flippase FtsW [Saprospiraceae bacterium]
MASARKAEHYDWITIGLYLSLLAVGWLVLYSIHYGQAVTTDYLSFDNPMTKHSMYLLGALTAFGIAQLIGEKFWHTFAYLVYGMSLLLLLLVLFFGSEVKGARAWFSLGGFSFQPTELAKFGTALALSSFMTYYRTNLRQGYFQVIAFGLILSPMLLILLQPDAGSALVFLSFLIMLFIEGLNAWYFLGIALLFLTLIVSFIYPLASVNYGLIIAALVTASAFMRPVRFQWLLVAAGAAGMVWAGNALPQEQRMLLGISLLAFALVILWKLKEEWLALILPAGVAILALVAYTSVAVVSKLEPHQQERIKVWLKPSECDPRGALYNVLQSKVAIGAGGFSGRGYLNGNMTRLKFVPEQSTDFVFSSIGEEQGFIGAATVILLFCALIYRIFLMSERAEHKFFRTYAACVGGLLLVHVVINIGMTLGLFPIIGIPLPFISKGGSALIGFSLMLGVLFRMQSRKG